MFESPGRRAAGVVVCLAALCGLFVLGGVGWPTPVDSTPAPEALDAAPAAYVGEAVELHGVVVDTSPTVVAVEHDAGVLMVELADAPEASVGDDVALYGEWRDGGAAGTDGVLVVDRDRAVVRAPWEIAYMYGVSVVGVLLVVARVLDGWRVSRRELAFVPRARRLSRALRGGDDRVPRGDDDG